VYAAAGPAAAAEAAAAAGLEAVQQQQQREQRQQRQALSQAFKQARREHGSARLEEQAKRLWGQQMCSSQCGSIAAKWCSRQCCGDCCRKAAAAAGADAVLCVRHKVKTPAVDEAAAAEEGSDAEAVENE
jgi:7-keto-8-aminopelargonate synthetase-like enzyme